MESKHCTSMYNISCSHAMSDCRYQISCTAHQGGSCWSADLMMHRGTSEISLIMLFWKALLFNSWSKPWPSRTDLARLRAGQHWLQTRIGRFGPHRVPYESRWCHPCALLNQHLVVESQEHASFECLLSRNLRQQQPWAQKQPCKLQTYTGLPPMWQARFFFKLQARYRSKFIEGFTPAHGQCQRRGRICLLGICQNIMQSQHQIKSVLSAAHDCLILCTVHPAFRRLWLCKPLQDTQ